MKDIISDLSALLVENGAANDIYKRNLLKTYLQTIVLDFLYSHPVYSGLIFYGGSCLAQCFGLPRLSEDLDFIDTTKKIKPADLCADLKEYFATQTNLPARATTQKFRVYLKFPILRTLGLARKSESDDLFLKVEIFAGFDARTNLPIQIVPLFKNNLSILVKTFDLPTLMATKLRAILHRRWEKRDKSGRVLVRAKGRDYFDLHWYFEQNVLPNMDFLPEFKNLKDLKMELAKIVSRLDEPSVRLDLEPFLSNADFARGLAKNLKNILLAEIERKL